MRTDDLTPPNEAVDQRLRDRVALMLTERRHVLGRSRRDLARAAGVDHRLLRRAEHGRLTITPALVADLARMYGMDPAALLPPRLPLEIRPFGVLTTNGVAMSFTPGDDTSLLASYLRLIRSVRNQETPHVIELRRDDIEVLAAHLGLDGEHVVARLGALMGVTGVQRRALVATYGTGAALVSLSTGLEHAAADQHAAATLTVVPARPPWAVTDMAAPHFSWSPDTPRSA